MGVFEAYSRFFSKHYKKLVVITLFLLFISLTYLTYRGIVTGEVVNRGISLKGGIAYTIETKSNVTLDDLSNMLYSQFPNGDFSLRSITGRGKKEIIIEATDVEDQDLKSFLESKGFTIITKQVVGAKLGEEFFSQAIKAVIYAFILMSIVVILYFRTFIPAVAVILSIFSDITEVIAIITLMGIKLNTPSIAALLMLIGYSVDTDILLTTRIIKRKDEKSLVNKLSSAMKTGFTMTLTTLATVTVAYFLSPSEALKSIMFVVGVGLIVDIWNTWIQNAALIVNYAKNRKLVD